MTAPSHTPLTRPAGGLLARPGGWLPLALAALLTLAAPAASRAQDEFDDADPTLEADAAVVVTDEPVVVFDLAAAESGGLAANYALDNVFLFFCAVLVLFMQAGFAMVEAGFNASKHTVNILFKNALDISIGVLLYYAIGFNLMYPGVDDAGVSEAAISDNYLGAFAVGMGDAATPGASGTLSPQVDFLFQVAFAATAATIVSGAVAGRMKFGAYLVYSAVLTGLVYPISGYWKWGYGFLDDMGFYDFAGSVVVHAVGGFAGLAGAIVLGPRLGRYTPDGKPVAIPGHSLPLATLGVFILLIGWFGFNPGSVLALTGGDVPGETTSLVMLVAVNTLLSASAGAVVATVLSWVLFGKPDLSMALNGLLGGLVGITANADGVTNPSAIVIGAIAGALVVAAIIALDKVRIDDPVGAFPVHGVCGIWGCLAIPIFADYGDGVGTWVAQLTGTAVICTWAFVTMFALFFLLKLVGFLRVSPEDEEKGLDISEHGMTAYST